MRISLIGPVYPYRGGIAHHTTCLAQALGRQHEVQVISFRRLYPRWLYPGKSDKDESANALKVAGVEYLLDPLDPLTWKRTLDRVRAFRPDKVVLPWWTTFLSPATWFLARRLGREARTVFVIHNVLPHEQRFFDRAAAKAALAQGDAFIVQSEGERGRLEGLLPGRRPRLCAHPVYSSFGERIPQAEAREKLGLPAEAPVVLFFGIVRPYKGLAHLIRAAALEPLNALKPVLVVAGEIWGDKQEYLDLIQEHGLGERVVVVDRYILNEELPVFFSAADIFAAPYVEGTQSGALKMALGFGLPIAASEAVVDAELLRENPGSITSVPAGNPQALAEAICEILRRGESLPLKTPTGDWQGLVRAIEEAG